MKANKQTPGLSHIIFSVPLPKKLQWLILGLLILCILYWSLVPLLIRCYANRRNIPLQKEKIHLEEVQCQILLKNHHRNEVNYGGSAIAFLVLDDFASLSTIINNVDTNFADNYTSDLVIFHSNYPLKSAREAIFGCTPRRILLCNIDRIFASYPHGFNPYLEEPTSFKRGKWNYHQMIRFWFKFIFELSVIRNYKYVMRLDDDARLQGKWFNCFEEMERKKAVYFANTDWIDTEVALPGTMKLKDFALHYQNQTGLIERDPKMIKNSFKDDAILGYYNNFEIMKISFFLSPDVRRWVQYIEDTRGIYKYRWGDALLRYLTLAYFAAPGTTLRRADYNLSYCHPCKL
ncbi:unnamed protein product [Rotaria socialis]